MRRAGLHMRLLRAARRFAADVAGATLVEFSLVLGVFLLLVFGLIDFGRMGYTHVMAQKATQMAARIAVVRPAVCPFPSALGDPPRHVRHANATDDFGTMCRKEPGMICASVSVTCVGSPENATAAEIFDRVAALLPPGATAANLQFRYSSDPNLGFLGGPFTPVVSVELVDMRFDFVSPLGALAAFAGATGAEGLDDGFELRAMSVSLPAEDLAHGPNQ